MTTGTQVFTGMRSQNCSNKLAGLNYLLTGLTEKGARSHSEKEETECEHRVCPTGSS